MEKQQIQAIVDNQRAYYASGATLPVANRLSALRKLKAAILKYENETYDALYADLGKSKSESYMCEIGLVLSEISHMLKHTPGYAREKRVATPLAQYVSRSYVKPSPYGTVLIMSPWNYPFLLTIDPLVDAIAAGNTCVVKPSAYSPATSAVMEKMLKEAFDPGLVDVVCGGRKENNDLLSIQFDYVFFTGSTTVGKIVLQSVAEYLTPVTLELGGKSPCVVDKTANLRLAAKRIVFGKFVNCGQTCVAPDYIYCEASIRDELVEEIKKQIKKQFGAEPLKNPCYGKIVNEKHFARLKGLINEDKVVFGNEFDEAGCRIAPTVMTDVTWDDAVMQEEIFGPIMPVLTFNTLTEAISTINAHPHPLALYMFSSDKPSIERITSRCQFGGGCVNDTLIHLATSAMGFGGVGASGMGSYHGKCGFDTFSHKKSIVDKKTFIDLPMRYQPYNKLNDKLIKMFVK
ncbi:MAG: aldehyde dehydrogenase [Firmicutes bacterium]|nr:aldehyde dehydrogenase [Bacillota bacterium]